MLSDKNEPMCSTERRLADLERDFPSMEALLTSIIKASQKTDDRLLELEAQIDHLRWENTKQQSQIKHLETRLEIENKYSKTSRKLNFRYRFVGPAMLSGAVIIYGVLAAIFWW